MTITPFLTLRLCGKKSALHARQTARRLAQLLCFSPSEQACIAAGAFVVACQGLAFRSGARLCFQIENRQLQVFVEELASEHENTSLATANRISDLLGEPEPKTLYRLTKPLPSAPQNVAELDLAWLVGKLEEAAPGGAFAEIFRQNQEMLALLHELRLCQGRPAEKEEKTPNPHAA